MDIKHSSFESPVPSYQLSLEEQQCILDIQHSILAMVASDAAEQDVFNKLCDMAEALLPNAVASIMLKDEQGKLSIRCAPNVPPEGKARFAGLQPGPHGGSCGNAVHLNQPVFVVDATDDPRCGDTKEIFKEFGLCACWSNPIRNLYGESIGSFALSSFEVREPRDFDKQLLAIGAHIAGIILERSEQQNRLQFMAYNDPLTGLLNRNSLFTELDQAIDTAQREISRFSLLFLDLDRFKSLNDSFGHQVGDEVLTIIAERLKSSLPDSAQIARVGGDEFVILINEESDVKSISTELLASIKEPINYQSHRFQVGGSIGIAIYPTDGKTTEMLLKNADTAMYHAKETGRPFCFYDPAYGQLAQQAYALERDLHFALHRQEFELFYQPQVDADSRKIIGLEALIRWNSQSRGLVAPNDFIPIVEQTGLIEPIGQWVVAKALEEIDTVIDQLDDQFTLSINISGAQLAGNQVAALLELINEAKLPNHQIELEITETFLVEEAALSELQLESLRQAGVRLAIDDFGIGYSSLAYLKRFNVNTLKIDRMLINDITTDQDDLAISKAVIALGHSLGLSVVAEGVETVEQAEMLKAHGCDRLQGYYFSKPVPWADIDWS